MVNNPLPIPNVLLQKTFVRSCVAVTTLPTILAQQYSQEDITGIPVFVVNVKESVPVGVYL